MYAMLKLSLGLALAATLTSAQTISSISGNLVSGGSITIDWTSDATTAPATFSVYIIHDSFNNNFGLANTVQTSAGTLTAELPVLPPGDGYTIEFVKIDDVNFVLSESKEFSVGATSETISTTITGHSNLPKTSATPISTPSATPISTPAFTSASTSAAFDTAAATLSTAPSDSAPSTSATGSSGALSLSGSVSGALMVALGVVAGAYAL